MRSVMYFHSGKRLKILTQETKSTTLAYNNFLICIPEFSPPSISETYSMVQRQRWLGYETKLSLNPEVTSYYLETLGRLFNLSIFR